MRESSLPDLRASMIDLLLGAMGGVACLVIVYLAIQNANAEAFPMVTPRELAFQLVSPKDTTLQIGNDIAVMIEDNEGQKAFLTPGRQIDDGTLTVKWPKWIAGTEKKYLVSVGYHPNNDLIIRLWIRTLADVPDELASWDPAHVFEVDVFWLDSVDDKVKFSLTHNNNYFEEQEAPTK
jgi:hypothetical protein